MVLEGDWIARHGVWGREVWLVPVGVSMGSGVTATPCAPSCILLSCHRSDGEFTGSDVVLFSREYLVLVTPQ